MLLAVCIPTHHGRAAQLRRALDSIAPGVIADERVEVCVSDNASSDETEQVVTGFAELAPGRVRYHRHAENLGFTANLLSAVELAQARWCWLLGSDDLVVEHGVAEVLALVERHPEVAGATFNRSLVDRRHPSVVLHDRPQLLPRDSDRERELRGEREVLGELGQLHDYISTQVVEKELWLEAVAEAGSEALARSRSYPHLLIIAVMVRLRPRWAWYPRELVEQRIGVSSVFDDSPTFDVSLYEVGLLVDRSAIWADLFGSWSFLHRTLLRKVWWRHFSPGVLLFYKLDGSFGATSDLRLLRTLPRYFWWMPTFWVITFPMLLVPGAGLRRVRPALRAAKEGLAARRPQG